MSRRYIYTTTHEQERDDGTIIASVDVRISYDFSPAFAGYFNPVTGVGEPPHGDIIEWVKVEEHDGKCWVKARETIHDWAVALIEEQPERFIENAAEGE